MEYRLDLWILDSGEYKRFDAFKDESISMKESVKDFNDPKRLFTAFSKSFSIPASKKNNRLLKHSYRIDSDGVDTRTLISAKITLNNVDYKVGNISIEGTKFKDGEPYAYEIRFYGKLTELSKTIGDDELTDLDFSALNIDSPNFKNEFETTSQKDVAFPLVCRRGRFGVNEVDADYFETENINVRNVYYSSSTRYPNYYGISEADMIGALKCGKILDAIEDKYGFNFTGCLKDANYITDLRLLLQKQGTDSVEGDSYVSLNITNISPTVSNKQMVFDRGSGSTAWESDDFVLNVTSTGFYHNRPVFRQNLYNRITSKIEWTASTTSFKLRSHLKRNGEIIQTIDGSGSSEYEMQSSDADAVFSFDSEASGAASVIITADISTDYFIYKRGTQTTTHSITASKSFSGNDTNSYNISENLPVMKIKDFLAFLLKRFNVIATIDENLNIDTKHYDYYISSGNIIDISQYSDYSSYSINRPNFYSGLKFTTASVGTVMERGFQKVNNRKYGELKYQITEDSSKLDGDIYKIDTETQCLPLETPTEINSGRLASQIVMSLTDKSGTEQQLAPTFFYTALMLDRRIAWDNGTSVEEIGDIYLPSNVYFTNETQSAYRGILGNFFGAEADEFQLDSRFSGLGLFNVFYKNLVGLMFNKNTRRVSRKATLPMKVIHSLSPSDVLIIGNQYHLIESFEVNFSTGETKLELINVPLDYVNNFKPQNVSLPLSSSYDNQAVFLDASTGLLSELIYTNSTTKSIVGGDGGLFRTVGRFNNPL